MTEPPTWSAPNTPPPDPPSPYGAPPPPGQQPVHGAPPPGYGPPAGYAPPGGYGPPTGYGPSPAYGQPAGSGAPQYGTPPPPYGTGPYGTGPYGNQPYAVAAPKPGIIPLRPLSVAEILDGSFTTIRRNPKATLGLSAVVACVQQGLSLGVQALTGSVSSGGGTSISSLQFSSNSDESGGDVARHLAGSLGVALVGLVLSAILTGVLCLVVSDSVLGQRSTAGSAWRRMRPMAGKVFGASLLVGICQILGLVLCLIPGAFLWGVWSLVIPALVLERIGVGAALRRSFRLVKPGFWRVFGIRCLGVLISGAVAAPFALIVFATGAQSLFSQINRTGPPQPVHLSAATVIVSSLVSIVVTTLTAPFLAGLVTLLYIDRRIRVEALDIQLQQAAAKSVAAVPAAPPPAYG